MIKKILLKMNQTANGDLNNQKPMILIIIEITIIEIIIEKININQNSPTSISQNNLNSINQKSPASISPNSNILTNQRISIQEMINMTMIKILMIVVIVVMILLTEVEMITTTTEITTRNKTTMKNMMMDMIEITIGHKDLLTSREEEEVEAEGEEVEEATRRLSTEVATIILKTTTEGINTSRLNISKEIMINIPIL